MTEELSIEEKMFKALREQKKELEHKDLLMHFSKLSKDIRKIEVSAKEGNRDNKDLMYRHGNMIEKRCVSKVKNLYIALFSIFFPIVSVATYSIISLSLDLEEVTWKQKATYKNFMKYKRSHP